MKKIYVPDGYIPVILTPEELEAIVVLIEKTE
jgi:hypothetical protein